MRPLPYLLPCLMLAPLGARGPVRLAAQTRAPCATWTEPAQIRGVFPDAWPLPIGRPLFAHAIIIDARGCPDSSAVAAWTSSDTTVLIAAPRGARDVPLQCRKPGVVTLTAASRGATASSRLVCGPWPAVARIDVRLPQRRLGVGDTFELVATPRSATGDALPAIWTRWQWDPPDAFRFFRQPRHGSYWLIADREVDARIVVENHGTREVRSVPVGRALPLSVVARLDVTPDTTIARGERVVLTATPRDSTGRAIVRLVQWRLLDTTALGTWRFDPSRSGEIEIVGKTTGPSLVEAQAGTIVVRRWVTVRAPEPPPAPVAAAPRSRAAYAAMRDSFETAARDRIARAAGLTPLRLARPAPEVRTVWVWTSIALAEPKTLYRIVDSAGHVSGQVYLHWHAERVGRPNGRGGHDVAWSDLMRYTLDGVCGPIRSAGSVEACRARLTARPPWAQVLAGLERHRVWTLPDQAALPPDSIVVLDGYGLTVEVRTAAGYRRYTYDNPNAHRGAAWADADSIYDLVASVSRFLRPSVHRRVYRGLVIAGAKPPMRMQPCDSTAWWEFSGDLRGVGRGRPRPDSLAPPAESLYVVVRGELAAPGLAAEWGSAYPEVLQADSVLHAEPWRAGRCAGDTVPAPDSGRRGP